jgi:hypothetical protein
VVKDVEKYVYAKGKGGDPKLIGTVLWNRGLAAAMYTVEAVRTAQAKFGKKPMTGEQTRWGIENLNIDQKRLDQLGFGTMVPPLKLSCSDHGGSGWCASRDGKAGNGNPRRVDERRQGHGAQNGGRVSGQVRHGEKYNGGCMKG